jgi:thioredoxin-dependent peroxiredoxin
MLSEGDKAPPFELESDDGKRFSLTEALKEARQARQAGPGGTAVVLYFYPKDSTPGCTREAQAFTEAKRKLAAAGATVAGVSKDSIKSHCGFRDKYAINFPLLSDPDLAVHRAYGAYGEKTMYGKKVMGTIRSTFLISPDGKIARAWRGVKVDGHVDAVPEAIKGAKTARAEKTGKSAKPVKTVKTVKRKKS